MTSISKRSIVYQEERIRRSNKRKQDRKDARYQKYWRYGRPSESECPECGGTMSWCSCCQVWSRSCCVDWGTCQCS